MVETALILPVLVLLFVGVYTACELISAENAATEASRNAARFGAEIGNDNYQPSVSSPDPTSVDQRILAAVNAALSGQSMPGARVAEVDVYSPVLTQPAGYFSLSDSSMLIDRYHPGGSPVAPYHYGLDARNQQSTHEGQIGVRVLITFTPPALGFGLFAGQHAVYSVFTFPPA